MKGLENMTKNINILEYMSLEDKEALNYDLVTLLFNEFKETVPNNEIENSLKKFGNFLNENIESIIREKVKDCAERNLISCSLMTKKNSLDEYISNKVDTAITNEWSDMNIEKIIDEKLRSLLDKHQYSIKQKVESALRERISKEFPNVIIEFVENILKSREISTLFFKEKEITNGK